jgi:GNAT superfamily N-acetyltransferase
MSTDARTVTIRRLAAIDESALDGLTDVLLDCVEGGASVSFMQPLTRERAAAFWRKVAAGVADGGRVVIVAEDADGICGTVQLILDLPENQPHRADVAKMLVHRRARRQGLAAALMQAAARVYERLGWVKVGEVPNFALYPEGGLCPTTFYYRDLGTVDASCRRR